MPVAKPSPAITVRVSMTDHERNTFDYFMRETAKDLWLISPAKSWIQLALQLGLAEPSVLHAISAVGSIHSAQIEITDHTLTRPAASPQHVAALQQYCKATASLQKYIDDAILREASIEPVLVCSILFVCFEVFQGKDDLALLHLRLGRRAIQNSGASSGNQITELKSALPQLRPRSQAVTDEVLATFDMLERESVERPRLGQPFDHVERKSVERAQLGQPFEDRGFKDKGSSIRLPGALPERFSSVEQAKGVLDSILEASSDLRMQLLRLAEESFASTRHASCKPAVRYCLANCLSRTVDVSSHAVILRRKAHLINGHTSWLAMVAGLKGMQQVLHTRQLIFLQIRHFSSKVNLLTCRETTECSQDRFEEEFVRMLDMIELYVNGPDLSTQNLRPPPKTQIEGSEPQRTFSLEVGILPTLYLICQKCRSPTTRRRALSILRNADRREGLHYSGGLAPYAKSIMDLEEKRAKDLHSEAAKIAELELPTPIPEVARFLNVVFEGIGLRDIRVVCGRYQHESGGNIELIEYRGGGTPLRLQSVEKTVIPSRC